MSEGKGATPNTHDARLAAARAEEHRLYIVAVDTLQRFDGLRPMPRTASDYPIEIEQVKNALALITEHRQALLASADELKALHSDFVRGSKSALNDADRATLRERLAADTYYTTAVAVADGLGGLFSRWDARRSRLNRDWEIVSAQLRLDVARSAADYEYGRRIEAADYEHRRRAESMDEWFKLQTSILDRQEGQR